MPIINSLGTLTYPKIYYYSLPSGGWVSNILDQINSISTAPSPNGRSSTNIYVDSVYNSYIGSCTVDFVTFDDSNGLISQLNPSGYNSLYTSFFPSNNAMKILGSVNDSSGNICVVGVYTRVVGSNRYYSIYVAKLNSAGAVLWQNAYYSSFNNDNGLGIKIDSSDNLYIVGTGFGTAGGGGNRRHGELLKIDTSGALQWSYRFSIPSSSTSVDIWGIDVDTSGNIYAIVATSTNYYVQKINSSGTAVWGKEINTAIKSICLVGSNIAVSTLDGIIVLDSSGNILGQKSAGLGADDTRICSDSLGNLYVIASTSGSPYYVKVCKFNSSYNTQWINQITTTNAFQTAILSGTAINTSETQVTLSFEQYQQTPSSFNIMWAYNLPVTGDVPKSGTYVVGGKQTTYATTTLINTATSYTATVGSISPSTLTITTASVSPSNATGSNAWSNYLL